MRRSRLAVVFLLLMFSAIGISCRDRPSLDSASDQIGAVVEQDGRTGNHVGSQWSLEDSGVQDIIIDGGTLFQPVRANLELPNNATAESSGWWLIHVDFTIEVDKDSGPGTAYLVGSVNGRTAAQVFVERDDSETPGEIIWGTIDLINGELRHSAVSPEVVGSIRNYLQLDSIQPGENILTFKVLMFRDLRLKKVTVHRSSGILLSWDGPPTLQIEVLGDGPYQEVSDKEFRIRYSVSNAGGAPAKNVGVVPLYDGNSLALASGPELPLEWLAPGDEHEGDVRFRLLKPGSHAVTLAVRTDSGIRKPVVHVTFNKSRPSKVWPILVTAGGFAALASLGVVIGRAIRSRQQV